MNAQRIVDLVTLFLWLVTGQAADAQSLGLAGVWGDVRSNPWEIVVIIPVNDSYRVTLLPTSRYQRQRSFLATMGDGYCYFENADEAYYFYPHPEENSLDVEHAYSGGPDSFTVTYLPLRDRRSVQQYKVLNEAGVRLRTRGDERSEALRTLEKGDVVTMLSRSAKKSSIDGSSAFWIEVRDSAGTNGWMFGAFLDDLPER